MAFILRISHERLIQALQCDPELAVLIPGDVCIRDVLADDEHRMLALKVTGDDLPVMPRKLPAWWGAGMEGVPYPQVVIGDAYSGPVENDGIHKKMGAAG